MNTLSTGYYSVIQYCPDRSRMEAANVGVLLFVADRNYLDVRFSSGNDRIRRFFSKDRAIDFDSINAMKSMMEHRFSVELENLRERGALETFLHRFANEITFTKLRSVRVENPEAELAQLFEELVGGRIKRDPVAPLESLERVRERFSQTDIVEKLQRDIPVTVPVIGDSWNADYAFQNGRYNLIRIKEFKQQKEAALLKEACQTAAEGNLLYKHRDTQHGEQQLMIIANLPTPTLGFGDRIEQLMVEHNVRFFPDDQLDDLANLIIATAH